MTESVVVEPVAVELSTAARMLDVGPTTVHRLIKAGKLDAITIDHDDGKRGDRRITVASIKRYAKVLA
jgi:hypothetical protein